MPRRPRRTSRLHPQKQSLSAQIVPTLWPSSPTSKDAHNPKPVSDDSDTGGGEESSTRVQDFSNDESTQEEGIGNEHDDLDVPRVAQWLDENELEMEVDGEDEEQNDGKLGRSSELVCDLSSISR
jgi:ribosomal RNA-processing protein 36